MLMSRPATGRSIHIETYEGETLMKKLMAILCVALLSLGAQAQDKKPADKPAVAAAPAAAKAKTPQQERMASCNKDASGKKGDERKKFMSECLKGGAAPAADAKPADQKSKMGYCNKEAGEKKLKGDERKKFMSDCLKK
jgi:hypothetical protein